MSGGEGFTFLQAFEEGMQVRVDSRSRWSPLIAQAVSVHVFKTHPTWKKRTTVVSTAIVWKGLKKDMHIRYNDLSTTLTKCYQTRRPGNHMCKCSFMPSWSHHANSITTWAWDHNGVRLPTRWHPMQPWCNRKIYKWTVDLGALNIEFVPCKAIKSQVLADFIAEWTKI